MQIEMILCPLCGRPICSTVGFDCHSECLYNKNQEEVDCLQRKYKKSCTLFRRWFV